MGRTAREKAFRWGAAAVATLAVTAAGIPASQAATTDEPGPKRVGSAPKIPHGAVRSADPAAGEKLDLNVVLEPRDQVALDRFVAAVSDPKSPQYRQYLGTGEFAAAFGAAPQTVAKVRAELEAKGLTVGELEADGLTLPVTTTIGGAAKAFRTEFDGYRLKDGKKGVANTAAPQFDGATAGAVRGVVGLSSLASFEPRNSGAKRAGRVQPADDSGSVTRQPRLTGTTPAMCSGIVDMFADASDPNYPPMYDKQDYWSARSLATAYNMANQPNVQTGTTIAIYSLENYDPKDIASYQACHGTKVPVTPVRVNGGPTEPAGLETGAGMETALDVQTIIGLAPQSKILVYQGPNTWDDGTDVFRKIVTENRAKVVSVSWGSCEMNTPTEVMDAENLAFQQAAAQGQTIVAASGDSGSTGCYFDNDQNGVPDQPNADQLVTDNPASSPYVLGVGGTTMRTSVTNQTTWTGSGGGVSRHFTVAADGFQTGRTGAGYSDLCTAGAGTNCRQVPDVSAVGDGDTGYPVAFGQDGGQWWWIIGGTSGAAPVWAALIAQADQDLACQANGPVGYAHQALYKLPAAAFRDVTTGHNNVTQSGNVSGLYQAGAGYDLATGLGTPNGREIVKGLCQAVPRSAATTFNALAPARILDTRYAIGRAGTAPVGANGTVKLKVAGAGGVPATGVTSVVMNITATAPSASGFLTAYPSGTTRPSSSNINWLKGQTIPNLVTVPVGKDGSVDLFNAGGGTTHFIADVSGYYSADAGGSTYVPKGPARILDTRNAIGRAGTAPVAGKGTVTLTVAGAGGVPATGATAVVLNVTATAPTSNGHLIAYPSGTTQPTASNINWLTGQTRPNMVVVPVGADGKVKLYNAGGGTVHFIADVFGYYTAATDGVSFHTAGPSRLLDTRSALGTASAAPLGAGTNLVLDLNDGHTLANAKAVVLNVTVTAPSTAGFLTVWPDGTALPNASNLNWTAGQTTANLVTVPVVNGKIDFRSKSGTVHVIADLFGYYM
ncbi:MULTISPECIES: protease pro-enzyme activation domain-containing protein [unclassified Streptomyces]|uniref:protease pro-enzyme activation domain-containing protein n=1 Tax=unclassified Streptomyces TaxID=2593676 RepID=UPI0033B45E15